MPKPNPILEPVLVALARAMQALDASSGERNQLEKHVQRHGHERNPVSCRQLNVYRRGCDLIEARDRERQLRSEYQRVIWRDLATVRE